MASLSPVSEQPAPPGFRSRGQDISRVEGFADCAFGFAVTLLVVSLEVPRTFDGLVSALQGIPSFAISFALLGWIWFLQYRFFRRYGLEDQLTVVLTLALVFVVLCFVYPLKFLYTVTLGGGGLTPPDVSLLFLIYGIGVAATFAVLALMHVNAYRHRDRLALNAVEVAYTCIVIAEMVAIGAIGLLSGAIAYVPLPGATLAAGLAYFLNGAVFAVGGRRRRLVREGAAIA